MGRRSARIAALVTVVLVAAWQVGLPNRFWMLAASVVVIAIVILYAIIDAVVHRSTAYNRRWWYTYAGFAIVILIVHWIWTGIGLFHDTQLYSATRRMEPTIRQGENFLVDYRYYKNHAPHAGDVAVYHDPRDQKILVVRRIVALAGERIAVNGGRAIVNGVALNESYAKTEKASAASGNFPEMIVPPGTVFVLADNRDEGLDSRVPSHGLIPLANLAGRVTDIGFSTDLNRMGRWVGTPNIP
jgi:signal peptidase I